ncbi:MAG: formate/nitrite transporter family protein [Nitrospiraceae bacterium]
MSRSPADQDQRVDSPVPMFDAYSPPQIAIRVREVGVAKANAPVLATLGLGILGGAFISLGALFYVVIVTPGSGSPAPFGLIRLAGGVAFSLGLVLILVGGAELFTGNNLIAMAWAAGRIRTRQLLENWGWVYLGNLIGAIGTVALTLLARTGGLAEGDVGQTAMDIARNKASLSPATALARGILCNALVCLAVWLCMGARGVADKILAIVFPISAFVACGFEHSIANMYFLPLGMTLAMGSSAPIEVTDALSNLLFVTIGNILGGTMLVALIYWFIYLRNSSDG